MYGNIIDIDAEILVNPANAKGYMGGLIGRFILLKGVAETIHYYDPSIEKKTKALIKTNTFKRGDIFHTESGKLKFSKGILHTVTMMKPGQVSNIDVVKNCLINIIDYCAKNNIKTVALPLLGTGTGKVNKDMVIQLYEEMLLLSDTHFKIVHFKA